MKILDQTKLIELYRGYFEFNGMLWPDDPRDAFDFAVSEVGEIFDALKRSQGGWVRHNDKDRDLGMEISQAIMMLVIGAEQAGIDVETATYHWMREKGYEGEYWAGKDYIMWAYPTNQSREIHLWGKFDGMIQSACGLEMPAGHDFGDRVPASVNFPRREPRCDRCSGYWQVRYGKKPRRRFVFPWRKR